MDAITHYEVAEAVYNEMPDEFRKSKFMKIARRLNWKEWTVIPDKINGDNIFAGNFHSDKYEFDENQNIPILKDGRPIWRKGSASLMIFICSVQVRNLIRQDEWDDAAKQMVMMSHYIVDIYTIWHLWSGKVSNANHQIGEKQIGKKIISILKNVKKIDQPIDSSENFLIEIAKRRDEFFLKYIQGVIDAILSGKYITDAEELVASMINETKQGLADYWWHTYKSIGFDRMMKEDAKRLKLHNSNPDPGGLK